MKRARRHDIRQTADIEVTVLWEGTDGGSRCARARARDFSEMGMRLESPVAIGVGKLITLEIPAHAEPLDGKIRYCVPRESGFQIGLEFSRRTRLSIAAESELDYYEVLQLSPKADSETIHRVYRILAARFHPDNPEGGDYERFLLVSEAYKILGDPDQRVQYDSLRSNLHRKPMHIFQARVFVDEKEGEANRRLGVLCLLYWKRRRNPDQPGISLLELEDVMSIPREYFDFTLWYLKEKEFVKMTENAEFTLTAVGVDFVEAHTPAHPILDKLLPGSAGASREPVYAESANVQ